MITYVDILNNASDLYDKLSENNFKTNNIEVEYRNCARMAYYSMLHLSKQLVEKNDVEIDMTDVHGTHEITIRKLMAINSDIAAKLANNLISCRKTRVKADYKIEKSFTKNDAYTVLRKAEKVASEAKEMLSTGT
ncbi:Uncharacterised protein [Providencia rustigianii]|nr:Uncharacterised protein [Providencia rustigianii]